NFHLYHEPDAPMQMDYFFWLARGADQTVVIDTGFSPLGGRSRGRTMLMDVGDALARLGADPALAPPVIVTHAHYDHIGNLALFPRSQVYMSERELAFWTGPHARHPLFHHSVDDEGIAYLLQVQAEGRLRLF